jgi:transglutaminase-like putative cysteine protease
MKHHRFHPFVPATVLALAPALLPHVLELPLWITGWCLGLWGYAVLATRRGWPAPGGLPLAALALAGFGGAMGSFGGAFYSQSYVAVLAVMASLKTLECRRYRDVMISLFLAYFLVVANLFYNDELAVTLYMVISVLLTTAILIHVHHPPSPPRRKLRLAGAILLQALPLTVILFYLFPRIEGNLWGWTQNKAGQAGFSDQMSPGGVARIVESDEIAFRVRFAGEIPPPDQRYWRGLTFLRFDGRTWHKAMRRPVRNISVAGDGPIAYTISLEPHEEHWLFALDMPVQAPDDGYYMNDYTLASRDPVRNRINYTVRSVLNARTSGNFPSWFKYPLELPESGNPRARELAERFRAEAETDREVVARAMDFLRENEFFYTLEPPRLGANAVDDFLFDTRRGYCEHYASAFAFLMRAAGVPARVVGGYLGGEINPYAEYMIVRQSDAHAWVEVHLPETGWTRVDPTSAVAPERVLEGVQQALSPEDLARLLSLPNLGPLTDMLRSLDLGWDAINAYWLLWVMSYTAEDQAGLLEWLGIDTADWLWTLKVGLLLMVSVAALLAAFAGIAVLRRERAAEPARRAYDRFCRKMARAGVAREAAEGPRDFAQRAAAARPDLAETVDAVINDYVQLRYGRPNGDKALLKGLEREVRRFAPGREREKRNRPS